LDCDKRILTTKSTKITKDSAKVKRVLDRPKTFGSSLNYVGEVRHRI